MIVGIGIDLVSVSRMKRVLDRNWAARFINRVFTSEETAHCLKSARPEECFAARFAAKEAVVKALGTGFTRGITPVQIMVCGGERQKPSIALSSNAREIAESMNINHTSVSLSHTDGMACAIVVLEKS
ncbi:MAG: holo-ACP synthase [Deltaproteobacteria bacterium]|nr:holo-ACP synthase [Deltaproteobacteria bacterium]